MKKNLILFTILSISILISACSKAPYKEETTLNGAALVYIYALQGISSSEPTTSPYYEIGLESHVMKEKIYPGEYLKYNLSVDSVEVSVIRNQIEKKSLNIKLVKGNKYFLRVTSYDQGFAKFDFELVPNEEALKEIQNTVYAIPVEDEETFDIFVNEDKSEDKQEVKSHNESKSKTQKIKEAYELQQDGIINKQEFEKLKAEIINAN